MDVDSSGEADSRVDPIRVFADRLRRLQVDSDGPSVRDLVRLTARVGTPYTRGTIQDKLAGRSAAPWEFVEAFVRACAVHVGTTGEPDLKPWRDWHAQMTRELAALRAGRRRVGRTDACPYRGLEAFTAEHAQWFHGRASAVQDVLAGLAEYRRGVLLLGPSGAGKSSLMQAGVLPALAAGQLPGSDRWITVVARPGKALLDELDRAGLPGAKPQGIGAAVAKRLAGEPAGTRLLLVVDQFEELLTPPASEEQGAAQREAADALAAAIGAPGLSVVLVLRDDFYPRLASQAPTLLQALIPGLLNVPASLNTQDLRDIITRPAEAVGLDCETGLPERIISDVLAADRHAPVTMLPLIELALQQLWQRRHHGSLTHQAYQRIGGIAGALTTWCDTAIEQLSVEQRAVAQRILTALVRPADNVHHVPAVRRQVPLDALRELADTIGRGESGHGVDEVLAVLTDHRIVMTHTARTAGQPDDLSGVPVAELVHEALIRDWAALREWVGQDHRFQDWLRRAQERHTHWTGRQDPGDLLHGSDLAEGTDWAAQRRLPEDIAGFLIASRRYQRSGVRRTRALAAVLAALLVVALAATGLALRQRQTALAAEQEALSRQFAAQSTTLRSADPDLASLLAVQAYRTSPTTQAKESVYAAADSPLLRRLTLVGESEWSVAFSPDGRTLASGGIDGRIRLWDVAGGQNLKTLTGHTSDVWSVQISPDGRTLASASADHTVRLWDVAGGGTGVTLKGHKDSVDWAKFSRDGHTLASSSSDGTVRLWDVAGRFTRAILPVRNTLWNMFEFSPDGRTLAAAGDDGRVGLWDVDSAASRGILTRHTAGVWMVAFSPDGRTLASASEDGTVRLSDVATKQLRGTLTGHTGGVRAVAFSPDGRTLATGSSDRTIRLWDVAAQRDRVTLTGHSSAVLSVTFSPDGRTLATFGLERVARLWDVDSGELRTALPGNAVVSSAFSPDGRILATGGQGGARLWDAAVGQSREPLVGSGNPLYAVAFSPDGGTLGTASYDKSVRLWDIARSRARVLPGHTEEANSIAFSPDGRVLATSGWDGARLWDVTTGQLQKVLPGKVNSVAFSPDGRTLAGGDQNGKVRLWDLVGQQSLAPLVGHTAPVLSVAFSRDGRTLATGSEDHTARVWDLTGRKTPATLVGHIDSVTAVSISPDGRTVATASLDGVRLFDVAGGPPRAVLTGHTQAVVAVAFSPDGRTLATGSYDRTARLWETGDGITRAILVGHANTVTEVAFSPDGGTLATGSWDGTARLWDIALSTLPNAIVKICHAVNRNFTPQERAVYVPQDSSPTAVCP